jgi:hypothetical protein
MVRRGLTSALLLIASFGATACPLCLGSQGYASAQEVVNRQSARTSLPGNGGALPDVIDVIRDGVPTTRVGYRLDQNTAGNAVLALPGDNGTRLKVVEVIRGEIPAEGTIEPSWVIGLDRGAAVSAKPLLLIRAHNWQSWANVGAIGVEYAGWLRQLSAAKATTNMTDAEWQTEAAFVLPYLENAEPLVAEIAYGELARAPYVALRTLKGHLDAQALRRWTADPQLANRQSLYTLLLGIGGDAADAARIEQRLDVAWNATDATNLGPMLAANLELRGPSRMAWIDAKYISDRDRTKPELDAALLALSVQGGANATIPRERIIESYKIFIDVHRSFAGFVAQDLAAWNYWDVGPQYIALMRSGLAQHPASRYAMWSYLKQSPRADAKAAVDGLAIAGK